MSYIALDHLLKPGRIQDINDRNNLSHPKLTHSPGHDAFLVNKYSASKEQVQDLIPLVQKQKLETMKKNCAFFTRRGLTDKSGWNEESENLLQKNYKVVVGQEEEIFFDIDTGFFSAILTCYNNHWYLETGPQDWWIVVNHRIASALEKHGNRFAVRKYFVNHEGKKELSVSVESISNIDYSWLFEQFSAGINTYINKPEYVDLMQADFSTTSAEQLIVSQISLMASMKNYFSYGFGTDCGIPGVQMRGTQSDWEKLIQKLNLLEDQLRPIIKELELESWFTSTKLIFENLLKTFKGEANTKWWSHILCWNETYGSGGKQWFDGWFPDFLGCKNDPEGPNDFPSGLVTVPVNITDVHTLCQDDGLLIAGTLGFKVRESKNIEYPIVATNHTWSLLLPVDSPLSARFKSSKLNTPKDPEDAEDYEPKCEACGFKTNGSQYHRKCFLSGPHAYILK